MQLVKMEIPFSPSWSIPHTLQHHVLVWEELSLNTKGQGSHPLHLSGQHVHLLPKKVSGHWCDPGQWQGRALWKQRCSRHCTQAQALKAALPVPAVASGDPSQPAWSRSAGIRGGNLCG